MPRKRKSYNEDDTAEIADGLDEEKEVRKSTADSADLNDDSDDDEELSLEELAEKEALEEETE